MIAATTKIEHSGPVIRAVLDEYAPDECASFEAGMRQAVLDRWWGIAVIRANPLSD